MVYIIIEENSRHDPIPNSDVEIIPPSKRSWQIFNSGAFTATCYYLNDTNERLANTTTYTRTIYAFHVELTPGGKYVPLHTIIPLAYYNKSNINYDAILAFVNGDRDDQLPTSNHSLQDKLAGHCHPIRFNYFPFKRNLLRGRKSGFSFLCTL
jgi:hypothetical protein